MVYTISRQSRDAERMRQMTETKRLYYEDVYKKEFTAKVLECREAKKGFHIILDESAFYPEGGGQPSDTGYLNDVKVKEVHEKEGELLHYTDQPMEVGTEVQGRIDWARRFDLMQQHSGEHMVSGLIHEAYGYDNVGFHMGSDTITIDLNGPLDEAQLAEIERKTNQKIWEDTQIKIIYPTAEELEKIDYRSKKEINEAIRLVEIEGVDCCACCAPHVRSTSEIGMIKILKAMKHKNGIRLYFVCGHRAFVDYQAKHLQAINISQKLSLPPDDLVKGIDQLLNENNQLKQELSSLKKQIIDQQVQSLPQQDHYLIFTNDLDRSLQQYYLNQLFPLCSNYVAIFVGKDENYRFIIASNNDSRELLNKLKGHFEIKGGGKANMVQGQIKGNQKTIQDILENN